MEQLGPELDFLKALLIPLHTEDDTRLKSPTIKSRPGDSTPGQFQKMLPPEALNAAPTTKSMAPNMARHAKHYWSTSAGATANMQQVGRVLSCKGYPNCDWEPALRANATKWAIPLLARSSPLPLGPCSEILIKYLEDTWKG